MNIPPFVKYEPCPMCNGTGWKRERNGYSLIVCPGCMGNRKVPITAPDGRWMKKGQNVQDWNTGEMP